MKDIHKIAITAIITFLVTCAVLPNTETQPSEDEILRLDWKCCHYCLQETPEEYMYSDNGDLVCPKCVYGAFKDAKSNEFGKCYQCNAFYEYDWSFGLGLCRDCGRSQITDCVFCFSPTFDWGENSWYAFCPSCMEYAMDNTNIEDILEKMRE